MRNQLTILFIFLSAFFSNIQAQENDLKIESPNGNIKVSFDLKEKVYYTVHFRDELVIYPSPLSLTVNEDEVLGYKPELVSSKKKSVDENIETVWGRRKTINDKYNEIDLKFKKDFGIVFRVYDDAVAFHFYTRLKDVMKVRSEQSSFYFPENLKILSYGVDDFHTSFEEIGKWVNITDLSKESFAYPPAIVDFKGKFKVAIAEANVRDYPGMYLSKPGKSGRPWLETMSPAYPDKVKTDGWNNFVKVVHSRKNYIAKTKGNRDLPWRILVITEEDKNLAENDIVYKLSDPAEISTDWIKPGKVTWEWWNDWNLEGVDFKTGINNETYKYYIDFASENNIEYLIMDEGWSNQFDLTMPVPGVDVPMLMEYARERNVKIILWCVWHTLDSQMEVAMDLFEKWGAAGVKVDFMDRDDQVVVNFIERCAKTAAKHKLLVDYHGCPKPTGLHRTFPNIINYEAVVGNEYNKGNWGGKFPSPEHNVTIPFTRMMVGPMDYTPGAMRNSTQKSYGFSYSLPMSRGTRCHQLAMFVVYDAGLQMLCDAPTEYMKYPDILEFLSEVPVSWDDTEILQGKIGDYIVSKRIKDGIFYIGGMTDWSERDISIDLSFLPSGNYTATMYVDGINAHRNAVDYHVESKKINKGDELNIHMAPGGGFAIVIKAE